MLLETANRLYHRTLSSRPLGQHGIRPKECLLLAKNHCFWPRNGLFSGIVFLSGLYPAPLKILTWEQRMLFSFKGNRLLSLMTPQLSWIASLERWGPRRYRGEAPVKFGCRWSTYLRQELSVWTDNLSPSHSIDGPRNQWKQVKRGILSSGT